MVFTAKHIFFEGAPKTGFYALMDQYYTLAEGIMIPVKSLQRSEVYTFWSIYILDQHH